MSFDLNRSINEMVSAHREKMRSNLARPYFKQDTIDPIRGADGKIYETLSGYRKTLLPSGNPRGEHYIEIGNEPIPEYKPPVEDRKKKREELGKILHEFKSSQTGAK